MLGWGGFVLPTGEGLGIVWAASMGILDLILNLAGLLLWMTWRSLAVARGVAAPGISLLATLHRTDRVSRGRWIYVVSLGVLLTGRAVVYWLLGSRTGWTPTLEWGGVTLFFRSDFPERMFLYSFLSFGVVLGWYYLAMLMLECLNHSYPDHEPTHRLVRAQLGRLARLPRGVLAILPFGLGTVVAAALIPCWAALGIMPRSVSGEHLLQQAVLLGAGAYLPWCVTAAVMLAVHLVHSHVYLGNQAFWTYLSVTSQRLLLPLVWAPAQIGQFDFRPFLGMAVALAIAEFGSRGLTRAFERLPW